MINITIKPANRLRKGALSHGLSHLRTQWHSGHLFLSQVKKFLQDPFTVVKALTY